MDLRAPFVGEKLYFYQFLFQLEIWQLRHWKLYILVVHSYRDIKFSHHCSNSLFRSIILSQFKRLLIRVNMIMVSLFTIKAVRGSSCSVAQQTRIHDRTFVGAVDPNCPLVPVLLRAAILIFVSFLAQLYFGFNKTLLHCQYP